MTMTIVSKLLHSVILKIREKATLDRDEALSHARVLDELFELDLAEHIAGWPHGRRDAGDRRRTSLAWSAQARAIRAC